MSIKKRKLAVFAGGWGGENLSEVLSGIIDNTEKDNFDVFTFINFSISGVSSEVNIPQTNFFKLPKIEEFDAVIMVTNTLNQKEEIDYLSSEIRKNKIPAVSVEYQLDGIPSIITDNYSGMYSLSEHIIKKHRAKEIVCIAGPEGNAESDLRLKALKDAMRDNSLTLTDENIMHGNWGNDIIPGLVGGWIEKNGKLPDAFVCANDIMAIAVCDTLRNRGYSVPEDTMVTGYDCISLAQNYNPPITSVNHEWFTMGQHAFLMIKKQLNKENVPEKISLRTSLIVGGTCGCDKGSGFNRNKKYLGRALIKNEMDPISVDSHFRHINSAVRTVKNKDELHWSLNYLFLNAHIIEGNDFSLFIYPEFFEEDFDKKQTNPFKERIIERISGVKESEELPIETVDFDTTITEASEEKTGAGYYIFVPLHTNGKTYGYARLNGPLNAASDNQYYIWSMHMMQALEQVEANYTIQRLYQKMEILSVTDPLTEVYNRAGCEKMSYPQMLSWATEGKRSVIMIVDVDRMKYINDSFGHFYGDKALKVIASSMKTALPKDYIISRFGGDEFFVAGKVENDETDFEAIIEAVEEEIKRQSADQQLEFRVTASMGYSIVEPKTIQDIEHAIDLADKDMYKRKEIHHLT